MIKNSIILSSTIGDIILYGTIDKKKIKLGYKKSVTIKGKRKITSISTYTNFNIQYKDLPYSDYIILNRMFEELDSIDVFYQNVYYKMIFDGDSFSSNNEHSTELKDDLYSGNIVLEESL